jgi:hypothetical protein
MDKFLLTYTYNASDLTHYVILWAENFDDAIQKLQFLYPGVKTENINAVRFDGIEQYTKDHHYFKEYKYKPD